MIPITCLSIEPLRWGNWVSRRLRDLPWFCTWVGVAGIWAQLVKLQIKKSYNDSTRSDNCGEEKEEEELGPHPVPGSLMAPISLLRESLSSLPFHRRGNWGCRKAIKCTHQDRVFKWNKEPEHSLMKENIKSKLLSWTLWSHDSSLLPMAEPFNKWLNTNNSLKAENC